MRSRTRRIYGSNSPKSNKTRSRARDLDLYIIWIVYQKVKFQIIS